MAIDPINDASKNVVVANRTTRAMISTKMTVPRKTKSPVLVNQKKANRRLPRAPLKRRLTDNHLMATNEIRETESEDSRKDAVKIRPKPAGRNSRLLFKTKFKNLARVPNPVASLQKRSHPAKARPLSPRTQQAKTKPWRRNPV